MGERFQAYAQARQVQPDCIKWRGKYQKTNLGKYTVHCKNLAQVPKINPTENPSVCARPSWIHNTLKRREDCVYGKANRSWERKRPPFWNGSSLQINWHPHSSPAALCFLFPGIPGLGQGLPTSWRSLSSSSQQGQWHHLNVTPMLTKHRNTGLGDEFWQWSSTSSCNPSHETHVIEDSLHNTTLVAVSSPPQHPLGCPKKPPGRPYSPHTAV